MPVTAKLSKLFYDRLGDQIADELVNWFNSVDDTYRNDLRELNELNFARFDAKLEQRTAELRSEFNAGLTRLEAKMELRFSEQTRWMVGMWLTVLLAVIAMGMRR